MVRHFELLGDDRESERFGPEECSEPLQEGSRLLGGLRDHLVEKRFERGGEIRRRAGGCIGHEDPFIFASATQVDYFLTSLLTIDAHTRTLWPRFALTTVLFNSQCPSL